MRKLLPLIIHNVRKWWLKINVGERLSVLGQQQHDLLDSRGQAVKEEEEGVVRHEH